MSNQQKSAQQQQRQQFASAEIKKIRENHPDCIPVFFTKHKDARQDLPGPKHAIVLFKKDLKIQQAMRNLYEQIKTKNLYFYTPNFKQAVLAHKNQQKKENKTEQNKKTSIAYKYVNLQPGKTIQQIANLYSIEQILTLHYTDEMIGMKKMINFERVMVKIIITLVIIWILLFAFPYANSYFQWIKTDQNEVGQIELASNHTIQL